MTAMIRWNDGDHTGGHCRIGFLDVANVSAAIAAFEAAAGVKGDWEANSDGGMDWWGLHGTYEGKAFTVYTHKSGTLKIGGSCFGARPDVPGLTRALRALLQPA